GWVNYQNPLPAATCVVRNRSGNILLVKRNTEPGMGRWSLPGGFIEHGEYAEQACLRELKEETGINGKIRRLIGIYPYKSKVYGQELVIAYEVEAKTKTIKLNNELLEAKYMPPDKLPDIYFSCQRKVIEDAQKHI
ncbi:MAG: NUDIX hydrolase, partial [Candidatus Aureabacteria bacterium]|nr:NUDIX hydrolase [Candidatus Auribacterota bacterium]